MDGAGMWLLAPAWLVLGAATVVAGVRARKHPRWLAIGRWALGLLFLPAGAGANALFLATGADYSGFADASYLAFVRDTWSTVVAPNQGLFIGLLIAFEAVAGTLVLLGRRWAQAGIVAIIAFHVALLSFGWGFYLWSLPMLVGLLMLLRAQRLADQAAAPVSTPGGQAAAPAAS